MSRLTGKTALISGAARGIGAAIARAFAREGARVWLTDIRDAEGAEVAQSIGAAASYRRMDVRCEPDWARVVAEIRGAGTLDILVNNAGVTGFDEDLGPQDVEHAALDGWRAVHAVNLDGVFLGCKHAIGVMKPPAAGGSIINLSSRNGLVGVGGAAAYASSKAAVRNHTKSVALYCAERGYGIRCNSIHPGAILTPMWDQLLDSQPDRAAAIADFVADVPLRRMGAPEDVAALAIYLAGDESRYVTGAEFVIDGGLTAGTAANPKR